STCARTARWHWSCANTGKRAPSPAKRERALSSLQTYGSGETAGGRLSHVAPYSRSAQTSDVPDVDVVAADANVHVDTPLEFWSDSITVVRKVGRTDWFRS